MARNFCSHTPRISGWAHWKAGNFLLKFKKNPDEKYFFIMEKFDFEKIFLEKNENIFENFKNPLVKTIFPI